MWTHSDSKHSFLSITPPGGLCLFKIYFPNFHSNGSVRVNRIAVIICIRAFINISISRKF